MEVPRDQIERTPSPDVNLLYAIIDARDEVTQQVTLTDAEGNEVNQPVVVSEERLRGLQLINRWSAAEIKRMEREAFADAPWDVVYKSATDPNGAFRKRFRDETNARAYVREVSTSAVFGDYDVVRRRLPENPEDLAAALEPRPIEDESEINESL